MLNLLKADKKLTARGVHTSEFWVGALTPIFVGGFTLLSGAVGFVIPPSALETIIISLIAPPVTYILGRIYHKKKMASKIKDIDTE